MPEPRTPRDILDFIWANAVILGRNPNGLDSTPDEFIDTALSELAGWVREFKKDRKLIDCRATDLDEVEFFTESYNQAISDITKEMER